MVEQLLILAFVIFGYTVIFFIQNLINPFFSGVLFGQAEGFPYTFQMFMWFPFFVGLFVLFMHYVDYVIGLRYYNKIYSPVSENTILVTSHFTKLIEKVKPIAKMPLGLAPKVLYQVIMKYQSSKSVEQASSMLNSLTELALHRLELKFSGLRYIAWLIPTLGFMGTVYGISITVGVVGVMDVNDPTLLSTIASNLAVAFDTTLLALMQAAILVYFSSIIESKEERTINTIGEYVLENIVNRVA